MSSVKRKVPPASLLQRRVRPRYEPEPESDIEDDESEAPSEEGAGSFGSDEEGGQDLSEDESRSSSDEGNSDAKSGSSEEVDDDDEEEEGEEEEEDGTSQIDASQLSFGALAKAQAAMNASSTKRRRDDKAKNKEDDGYGHPTKLTSTKKPEKRSSKHAPVEMTAKKPVSRKREFLTVTAETKKPQPRDPRFMPLGPGAAAGSGSGGKIDEIKARKAYAFLDEYRESEMQQLRAAIKKTKDPAQKEQLQRALTSMESRKKAQERKDRERAVLEEHRRKEKELVRQGKTPFYLKRSEQKKRVLVEQFQGLKKKQVDKVIERRRKKIAAREKKLLPMARRGAEDR